MSHPISKLLTCLTNKMEGIELEKILLQKLGRLISIPLLLITRLQFHLRPSPRRSNIWETRFEIRIILFNACTIAQYIY